MAKYLHIVALNPLLVLFAALIFFTCDLKAETLDTLTVYSANSTAFYHKIPTAQRYIGVVYLNKPIMLHGLSLGVFGPRAKNSFKVEVFDHYDGSVVIPVDLRPVYEMIYDKTQDKYEEIIVEFDKQIEFRDNMVLVSFTPLTKVNWVSDRSNNKCVCNSKYSGNLTHQVIELNNTIKYDNHNFHMKLFYSSVKNENYKKVFEKMDLSKDIEELNITNFNISIGDIDGNGYDDILTQGNLILNIEGIFKHYKYDNKKSKDSIVFSTFIDIDGDGDLDILNVFLFNTKAELFINDNFEFIKRKISFPRLWKPSGFTIADYNSDGNTDIFITQESVHLDFDYSNFLLQNTGEYQFEDVSTELYLNHSNCDSRGAAWFDFNNDTYLDLYVLNFRENDELWINNGEGQFKLTPNDFSLQEKGLLDFDFYIGDLDADGYTDLVKAYSITDELNYIVHQPTLKRFVLDDTFLLGEHKIDSYERFRTGVLLQDFDLNGYDDLVTSSYFDCHFADYYSFDNEYKINSHLADFNFSELGDDIATIDINNDGLSDLITIDENRISIYKNNHEKKGDYVGLKGIKYGSRVELYENDRTYIKHNVNASGNRISNLGSMIISFEDSENDHYIDSLKIIYPNREGDMVIEKIKKNEYYEISELFQNNTVKSENKMRLNLYPNPFSEDTNLSITQIQECMIKIVLSNVKGESLSVLYNGILKPGKYNFEINSKNYSLTNQVYYINVYTPHINYKINCVKVN